MDYKQTPLGRYIGTFAQEAVAVAYKVTAELITPSMTVSVPLVTQVHTYRDYERNAGDELYISVKFPPGSYGKYILPYQQQLKMRIIVQAYSLMRGQRQTVDDATQAYVYRAVCLTTVDSRMSATDERTATDSSKKDYEQMVDLQFQLFDPVLESFMQSETGENYTGSKVLDVLRLEFSKILSAVEADTGFKMQGVDIVAPNNDNLFKLLILPHGTNAMDLVDKIQNQVGIYSADVGCYYQSPYLYIYPLYDETRFSDGRRTAIFYNYPADMFPGMDKTWINRDKYVEIACTRGASVSDVNNAASLLGNAGGRFVSASQMSQGMTLSKGGDTIISRTVNVSEYVTEERSDNVKVAKGMGRVTDNRWRELSNTAGLRGRTMQLVWEYANMDLLYPGMPAKVVWMQDNNLCEAYGVIMRTDCAVTMAGSSVREPQWTCHGTVTLWLAPEKDNTVRPTV